MSKRFSQREHVFRFDCIDSVFREKRFRSTGEYREWQWHMWMKWNINKVKVSSSSDFMSNRMGGVSANSHACGSATDEWIRCLGTGVPEKHGRSKVWKATRKVSSNIAGKWCGGSWLGGGRTETIGAGRARFGKRRRKTYEGAMSCRQLSVWWPNTKTMEQDLKPAKKVANVRRTVEDVTEDKVWPARVTNRRVSVSRQRTLTEIKLFFALLYKVKRKTAVESPTNGKRQW